MNGDPLTDAILARRPFADVDVVDAHAHLGPYSRFFIPDADADGMVRVMDRCGVRRAIISANLAIELDASAGNELTLAAMQRYPERFFGHLVANPHQDPEKELARRADAPGVVGIKLHPTLHNYPVTGPRYRPVWKAAGEQGMPVLVHSWFGAENDSPDMIATVAERYPETRILMGHAGGLPPGFERAIDLARRHSNLYLEICGSYFTGYWLERMVGELGAHRIAYGSDFPFLDMRYSIGRVAFAHLSLDDRLTVLSGTIDSLLTPT